MERRARDRREELRFSGKVFGFCSARNFQWLYHFCRFLSAFLRIALPWEARHARARRGFFTAAQAGDMSAVQLRGDLLLCRPGVCVCVCVQLLCSSFAEMQTTPLAEGQGRNQAWEGLLQGLCTGTTASSSGASAEAVLRSGHLSALGHLRSHPRPGILTKVLTKTRSAT